MRRIRVKVTPQPIGFYGDIARSSLPSAFENSMFYEVADAVELRCFVTRPAANPDSGGDGPESRHVFGQNGDAVRESGSLNVVDHGRDLNSVGNQKFLRQTRTAVDQGV